MANGHVTRKVHATSISIPDPLDFDIDPQTGFVSLDTSPLPAYFDPWTSLVTVLPDLLGDKQLGLRIEELPILSTSHLTSDAHWRRAYVTLGFLVHAYVWEFQEQPRDVVPPCLGQPFVDVCEHLGLNAVLSYAGLCLWNCVPRGIVGNDTAGQVKLNCEVVRDFGKIEAFASFTRTRDEDAFYLVPVMVETLGGRLVALLLEAIHAGMKGNALVVAAALETCASVMEEMVGMLTVLHEQCTPDVFYHDIRPLLGAGAGAEDRGLPNGIRFQCLDRGDMVAKYAGGSAGQSSLFQFFDCVFGIQHTSKLLLEMRAYMPAKHRLFLEAVEHTPNLPAVIEQLGGDRELSERLVRCIEVLQSWRTKHIAVVVRYIVQTAQRSRHVKGLGGKQGAEQGTAGSLPVPFLKQYRDETKVH